MKYVSVSCCRCGLGRMLRKNGELKCDRERCGNLIKLETIKYDYDKIQGTSKV